MTCMLSKGGTDPTHRVGHFAAAWRRCYGRLRIRIIALMLLAGALVACHSGQGRILDSEALGAVVERESLRLSVPATLVMVRTPDQVWRYTHGNRSVGEPGAPQVDDHFRIGSSTKTMTGTVLLQMAEAHRFSLDDPIAGLLPGFDVATWPVLSGVTVRHLLDMSSGLGNYTETPEFARLIETRADIVFTPAELAAWGLRQPSAFPPGGGYRYSNTNTILAGLLVEHLSGRSLAEEIRDRIFLPLGLARSSFPAIDDTTLPAPHPRGYLLETRDGEIAFDDVTNLRLSWTWAAGAVISTLDDLADYIEALVNGSLLGEPMQAERLASLRPIDSSDSPAEAYGLALWRMGAMVGHDGILPGFQTFAGHDPETGITLVVVTTLSFGPTGELPANEIASALVAQLAGRSSPADGLP